MPDNPLYVETYQDVLRDLRDAERTIEGLEYHLTDVERENEILRGEKTELLSLLKGRNERILDLTKQLDILKMGATDD